MSPLVSGVLEIVDLPLYDTVAIPRASADSDLPPVILFHDPMGVHAKIFDGSFRVKSEIETNMFDSETLPPPCKFLVQSIRAALLDRQGGLKGISSQYYRAAVLDFRIAQKSYWRGPLYLVADPAVMFCEGPAPFQYMTAIERECMIRAMRHTFNADAPPVIETAQPFHVRVTFDPAADWQGSFAPGAIVVVLEGQEARAVV